MSDSGEKAIRRFIWYLVFASACMLGISAATVWPITGNPAESAVYHRIILKTAITLTFGLVLLIIAIAQVRTLMKLKTDPQVRIAFKDERFTQNMYKAIEIAFGVNVGFWFALHAVSGLPHKIVEEFMIPVVIASFSTALLYLERE